MEFSEIAMRMFPYWIMGIIMICVVYRSKHRELLKIDWNALKKFSLFMAGLTVYRAVLFHFAQDWDFFKDQIDAVSIIPWQATLTVFWEDMCHTVPLVMFHKWLEGKKHEKFWKNASLGFVMASFGLGHLYQGWFAVALLSLYIPWTMKIGKKYGFGTVMIGHTLYDLATVLLLKFFV